MPVYEYECSGCGKVVEVLKSGYGIEEIKCGKCGAEMSVKVVAVPHVWRTGQSPV